MNQLFICTNYGMDSATPTSLALVDGADVTVVARTLALRNAVLTDVKGETVIDTLDNTAGFGVRYRGITGQVEVVHNIKNATFEKIVYNAAVAKVAQYTFSDGYDALDYGKRIFIEAQDLSKDPYDKKRVLLLDYVLTTNDDLTTAASGNYWLKNVVAAWNAKHTAKITLEYVSAYVFKATAAVAGLDFEFSTGGNYATLTESITTANEYAVNTSTLVKADEVWYSTRKGKCGWDAPLDSDMYSVPTSVTDGKTYTYYVITWWSLSTEHPLGQGTGPVQRELILAIEDDAARADELDIILGFSERT